MFFGRLAETNIVAETEGTAIRERYCRGFILPGRHSSGGDARRKCEKHGRIAGNSTRMRQDGLAAAG